MNEEQLKQLQNLSKVFDPKKIVSADDIKAVVKGIAEVLKKNKAETKELNQETVKVVNDLLGQVAKEHDRLLEEVQKETKNVKSTEKLVFIELKKALNEVKDIAKQVENSKPKDGKDGKDADEEVIVDKVLAQIKIPEFKEVILDDAGKIRDKLETLEGEERLDASAIKNLPEAVKALPAGTRVLSQMVDVDASGVTNGQVLSWDSTLGRWKATTVSGTGDVVGPASATDNAIARFDTTTGKLIQNSAVTIDDSGNMAGVGTLNTHTIPGGTGTFALTSQLHDAVTVSDSAEIDFTLTGQDITASLIAGSIDETKLNASVNASLDLADSALQSSDIGVSVQAYDADLSAIAGLANTDGNIIVGNGTTWVAESGATARTSLGLGSGDSPTFAGLDLSDGNLTNVGNIQADSIQADSVSGGVAIKNNNGVNVASFGVGGAASLTTSLADGLTIAGVFNGATQANVDNLRLDGNTLSSTDANGNINLTPNGTGNVAIGNFTLDADQTVGAGQDNYVLKYDNGTGLISLEAETGGGGGGITWNEVTGTSQTASTDNGYITNNAGLVTITLPDTAALGTTVRVAGKGAGGWTIAQNAGETIHFGNTDTTTGVGGSLSSTNRYDAVELVCITANTDWVVVSSVGNITVV